MRLCELIFVGLAVVSLLPFVSAGWGLLAGIALALSIGNPFLSRARSVTSWLLQYCVMGLGAAMDLGVVLKVGAQGVGFTAIGIAATFALGSLLGRMLRTDRDTSLLLTSGTAICGGSAIAAVASAIAAKPAPVSVALATVFFLNALALFVFPWTGRHFQLDQHQFGLWSALAIHDTSSVVGASLQYGPRALEVATTVKLARALWIVPLAFGIGMMRSGASKGVSAKKPWFILGFLGAAAVVTLFPMLRPVGEGVAYLAKRGLVLSLFLIGSGLTRETLKSVGPRPFFQGLLLWVLVAAGTLGAILSGWVR
jgi:uncharacterized integral membrane protein (TIGR00698 family)